MPPNLKIYTSKLAFINVIVTLVVNEIKFILTKIISGIKKPFNGIIYKLTKFKTEVNKSKNN